MVWLGKCDATMKKRIYSIWLVEHRVRLERSLYCHTVASTNRRVGVDMSEIDDAILCCRKEPTTPDIDRRVTYGTHLRRNIDVLSPYPTDNVPTA